MFIGSSPRVRGTRNQECGYSVCLRFIPACAGNARRYNATMANVAVHPRVCGERNRAFDRKGIPAGSSPRVRGTRTEPCSRAATIRFIPACAGNASTTDRPPSAQAVHPRVCGERNLASAAGGKEYGSSPRVRGTHYYAVRRISRVRFIPACAGNADERCSRYTVCPVHPRVCGERDQTGAKIRGPVGSSPRVRGTPRDAEIQDAFRRFIPACAGNAERGRSSTSTATVHPRVCGERAAPLGATWRTTGSSPRVRGTHASAVRRIAKRQVHPRVCGERLPGVFPFL